MSPGPPPRTCGARIPVTADLRAQAHAAQPDVPGVPRASVLCELAEHGPERHAGLVRPLDRPEGGAVWVTWTTEDVLLCFALDNCGKRGSRNRSCGLFIEHPGICSHEHDEALREDPARVTRINAALVVLAAAAEYEEVAVQQAAHDAALLTWDELGARRIWPELPTCDHAAMYRLLALSNSVRSTRASVAKTTRELAAGVTQMTRLWNSASSLRLPHGEHAAELLAALDRLPPEKRVLVLGSQCEPRYQPRMPFDEAVDWISRDATKALAPSPAVPDWKAESHREQDERHGAVISERLARLPLGWQIDVVRRVALGADALGAVTNAGLSINVIRTFGIYLAWNAPGPGSRAGHSSSPLPVHASSA